MDRRVLNGLVALGLLLLCRPGWADAMVSIEEHWNAGSGYFAVTNNSTATNLHAFAVANDSFTEVWTASSSEWVAQLIGRAEWEVGFAWAAAFGSPIFDGPDGWTPPDTSSVTWDTYFGSAYDQVALYATGFDLGGGTYANMPIAPGDTNDQFFFSSEGPASPFVAFGPDGILGSGETTVVPIPPAVWLLGSAVIGLIAVGRPRGGTLRVRINNSNRRVH